MENFQKYLKEHHIFILFYWQAYEILSKARKRREGSDDIYVHLYFNKNSNRRCYNLSNSNKVVVVMSSNRIKV